MIFISEKDDIGAIVDKDTIHTINYYNEYKTSMDNTNGEKLELIFMKLPLKWKERQFEANNSTIKINYGVSYIDVVNAYGDEKYVKEACKNSGFNIDEQLVEVNKLSKRNNNAVANIQDYKLSRYICYLIVQNGESTKEIIALGQTYFAVQTRKQELIESEYDLLTEDEKRIYQRNLTRKGNFSLNQTAKKSGVKNFDKFHMIFLKEKN